MFFRKYRSHNFYMEITASEPNCCRVRQANKKCRASQTIRQIHEVRNDSVTQSSSFIRSGRMGKYNSLSHRDTKKLCFYLKNLPLLPLSYSPFPRAGCSLGCLHRVCLQEILIICPCILSQCVPSIPLAKQNKTKQTPYNYVKTEISLHVFISFPIFCRCHKSIPRQ